MGIAPHSKALICIYLNFGEDGGYTTLDICQTTLKSGTLLHTECFIEAWVVITVVEIMAHGNLIKIQALILKFLNEFQHLKLNLKKSSVLLWHQ